MTKKKTYTRDELALASVLPAVSADTARVHMCKPFGRELVPGRGFLIGTDGHRLHAVECEGWRAHDLDTAARETGAPMPPPVAQVVPWDAPWVGEFSAAGLDEARVFPSRWQVTLEIGPNGYQRAHCSVREGSGKRAATRRPFGLNGVPVEWLGKLEQLTFSTGLNLAYLLDAVDCLGSNTIHVWAERGRKNSDEGLRPIAFTATRKPLREQSAIAVVMPVRV